MRLWELPFTDSPSPANRKFDNGTQARHVEAAADDLVRFVLNGKKTDPRIVKKTEVKFPGDRPVEAHAYLLDDNTIHIDLKDPEMLATLFESLDVYGISFYGIPASPVDTSKDS